jgi:GNAT superfamily N-acetyltransferase
LQEELVIEIRQATTETDFSHVGRFYHAFGDWLTETYPEIVHLFEAFFIELEAEIESLPGIYSPPTGSLLIATYNRSPAGTVSLADLGQNHCEMRRMFVDSQFRGAKIGRALAKAIITRAQDRGYTLNVGVKVWIRPAKSR